MFNIWFAVVKEKDLARLDLICGLYEHKQHLQTEIRIQMLINDKYYINKIGNVKLNRLPKCKQLSKRDGFSGKYIDNRVDMWYNTNAISIFRCSLKRRCVLLFCPLEDMVY